MQLRWTPFVFLVLFALSTPVAAQVAPPQQAAPDTAALAQQAVEPPDSGITEVTDIRSFWQLTELGGGIRWAIFAVFAIGLFLVVAKWVELLIDKNRARALEKLTPNRLTLDEVQEIVLRTKPCLLGRLLAKVLNLHEIAGPAASLHEEILNFARQAENRFATFRNRMLFLADTAGALGLLGTVWGMFLTFFGGNLDSQRILNGMGIALITTLMGLVVSVILNFASTELSGFFDRRLEVTTEIGDALRLELLRRVREGIQEVSPATPALADNEQPGPPASVKLAGGNHQSSRVGQPLKQPLVVRVTDESGNPVPGTRVTYSVSKGEGWFEGGGSKLETETDGSGLARARFILGDQTGVHEILAIVDGLGNSPVVFDAMAQGEEGAP
jgi:biopolymer transport protein ExbB/TolQ